MRFVPGANGTAALADINTPNVGVAFALIESDVEDDAVAKQTPLTGSVGQMAMEMGKLATPESALTLIVPAAPTLAVATANAPTPPLEN